jgi:hypothetical protein
MLSTSHALAYRIMTPKITPSIHNQVTGVDDNSNTK